MVVTSVVVVGREVDGGQGGRGMGETRYIKMNTSVAGISNQALCLFCLGGYIVMAAVMPL